MRKVVPALLLSTTLAVCGCAAPPAQGTGGDEGAAQQTQATGGDESADSQPQATGGDEGAAQQTQATGGDESAIDVVNGTPAVDGWLDDAVAYCQEHADENGVLVQFTALMSQGFNEDTVSDITFVMPDVVDEDGDPMEPIVIEPGSICADVHFAEPVEVTRWYHLMSVRGVATLDPAEENKIIVKNAIEVES